MPEQKIYQKRVRDFGQIFGATFGYIKQNFRSFYGSIILFTSPFIVIIALLLAYIVSNAVSLAGSGSAPRETMIIQFIGVFTLIFFLSALIQAVYVTVLNQHLILNEELPEGEFIKASQVRETFLSSFWRVFGNSILLFLILMVFGLVYALVIGIILGVLSLLGPGGIVLGMLIYMGATFIIMPISMYIFVTSIFVVQRDKIGIGSALGKVISSLKGNFWMTWIVSFAGYMMTYMCTLFASIPVIIFTLLLVFTRVNFNPSDPVQEIGPMTYVFGALIFILFVILTQCVYSMYFLICSFQFSSLEEKRDGKTIIEKINQIQ